MISLRRAIIGRTMLMLTAVGLTAAVVAHQAALYEANQFMDDYLRQFAEAKMTLPPAESSHYLLEPEDRFEQITWSGQRRSSSTQGAPTQIALPSYRGFGEFREGQEVWRTFVVGEREVVHLVAQRESAREELAQHAAIEISLVILATMFVVWLVVGLTVGRATSHFSRLGENIAKRGIDANDPLPLADLPREIQPLANAMNILIQRQRAGLEQQRHFIADSAHELRTPLTALRIQVENLKDADPASRMDADALRRGVTRATGMLDQLLRMARFDAPIDQSLEDVDLADLLTQCVADVVEIAEDAGVDVGITLLEATKVSSVRADLQAMLSNLLDNAVAYTPRGGSVDCILKRAGEGAVIEVIDTGPGVKPEHLPRLFDRFFRAAELDKIGSGLGLAIVKAVADRHGLLVSIDNRLERSGLKAVVQFPRTSSVTDSGR